MSEDVTGPKGRLVPLDPCRLGALVDRLTMLENGLREELAAQVRRPERAEGALAAAQARAAADAIRARTDIATPPDPDRDTDSGDLRPLAAARREAARIVAEARQEAEAIRQATRGAQPAPEATSRVPGDAGVFRDVLVQLRQHLIEREALTAELVDLARAAVSNGGCSA